MADISQVRYEDLKTITDSLEGLSCKYILALVIAAIADLSLSL